MSRYVMRHPFLSYRFGRYFLQLTCQSARLPDRPFVLSPIDLICIAAEYRIEGLSLSLSRIEH